MADSFRDNIIAILSEYANATQQAFSGHALANRIRHDFPSSLQAHWEGTDRYIWQGSAG